MASWIAKPWIEQALMSRNGENLPKIARAQILKLEETSDNSVAFISDKKLFVKALFSQVAIEQFKRDNTGFSMADIQGGLIFIKKYSLQATCGMGKELDSGEFVVKIEQFKFAGGEGNTQFGSNIIDSSTYPPLQPRLKELCRLSQVRTLLHGDSYSREAQGDGNIPSFTEIERTLLENHDHVFIPEDMEKKLVEIPEWKPSYCPPLSCSMHSEISSFGSTPSNGGLQVQTCVQSMAVNSCEKSPAIEEKRIHSESESLEGKKDNSQTISEYKVSVEKTTIEKEILAKSEESLDVTRICLRSQSGHLESSLLANKSKDVVSSIPTTKEQKQGIKTLIKICSTDACKESREFNLLGNAIKSSPRSTKGEKFVVQSFPRTSEPEKQTELNKQEKQEKQESPKVCTANGTKNDLENGCGPRMTVNGDQLSRKCKATDGVADISSQAKVLCDRGLGQSLFLEHQIRGKGNNDSNSKFDSTQEESTIALIKSECVPSSQRSLKVTQPLRGIVTDECSSSRKTSHLKGSSEESYSILQKRSPPSVMEKSPEVFVPSSENSEEFEQALPSLTPGCTCKERLPPTVMEKSPDVGIVPSSENSEEIEQAFPSLTTGCTAKQLHCSLSESQLENLLDSSISFDVGSAPRCFKDASAESQGEVYTQVKQRESSPCCSKTGDGRSSPESSHLRNITVREHCIASNKELTEKKSFHENEHKKGNSALKEKQGLEGDKNAAVSVQDHVIQTQSNALLMDFDALFSQNTWSFTQISDKELSANLVEIDRRQSVKRKRSDMEDHVHVRFTCPSADTRQVNKVHLNDSPPSPDSMSHSVKSSSHSGSSQSQLSNHSPSIYLTKPMDLYSQQDPLLLDTSAESADSTDGVIDNDSGFLITGNRADDLHRNTSPSILERSIEEPCSLTTPTFDSLPSYQVPAEERETTPSRDQRCQLVSSSTRHQEAEPRHEPGTDKKRKPRRRKFNWFSDAF